MTRTRLLALGVFAVLAALVLSASVQAEPEVAPAPRPKILLPGYKTVAEAIKADPKQFKLEPIKTGAAAGYLGVLIGEKDGKPVIEAVEPDSPADKGGLKDNDTVLKLDGAVAGNAAGLRDALRGKLAGDVVSFTVSRGGSPVQVTVTLGATSKPMQAPEGPMGKGGGAAGGWNDRIPRAWRKGSYNLAIIGV